ncbi:hypothetical protein HKD37_03G007414 [Glycine soja]
MLRIQRTNRLRILLILPFPLNKRFQRTNRLRILCLNTLEGTSFVALVEGTSTWVVVLRTREGTSLVEQFKGRVYPLGCSKRTREGTSLVDLWLVKDFTRLKEISRTVGCLGTECRHGVHKTQHRHTSGRSSTSLQNPRSVLGKSCIVKGLQNPRSAFGESRFSKGSQNPRSTLNESCIAKGLQNPRPALGESRIAKGSQNPWFTLGESRFSKGSSALVESRFSKGSQNLRFVLGESRITKGSQNPRSILGESRIVKGSQNPKPPFGEPRCDSTGCQTQGKPLVSRSVTKFRLYRNSSYEYKSVGASKTQGSPLVQKPKVVCPWYKTPRSSLGTHSYKNPRHALDQLTP